MRSKSSVAEGLKKARRLLEKGWTQGNWAVDQAGRPVDPEDPSACSFCLGGALCVAMKLSDFATAIDATFLSVGTAFASFNDAPGRTKSEVLAALDTAIEIAKDL
jgi:hypothetical protein